MQGDYVTVAGFAEDEFVEKKSRFIGHSKHVETEAEALAFVAEISKKYWDATHNVYAFSLRDGMTRRYSDDGEPQGTAGVPVLDVILKEGIVDVCVVVTRYFGGIKLGAGGLIRAYSNTTTEAIHQAGLVQRIKQAILKITVTYALHDPLLYYLKENNLEVASEEYGVNVETSIYVNETDLKDVKEKLINCFNDQLQITEGDQRFNEIPY